MLSIGTKAPAFSLPDKDGNIVNLSDFRGKKVVIYFYPKDDTPGCTRQACAFAREYPAFQEAGAVVVGISKDSAQSHISFANKYNLPFILLSDENRAVIEAYDVWKEKKSYGKTSMGVVRTTYLVDEDGVIVRAYDKVNPDDNAEQMLNDVRG